MCGICGIIYKDREKVVDNALLTGMRDLLLHRGPDDAGNFIYKNVGLGARRLSIIDIGQGHQPIHNEDKTAWIVFNGEIYNYAALRESLLQQNHIFYTHSDTEVILHLYEEYNSNCLAKLRGMFAFAIWNCRTKTLFLARDRLGIKPLYYAYKDGNLIFSSELKSILTTNLVNTDIDNEALSCYFSYGYIPSPYSIFKEIRKLPPANFLLWHEGALQIYKYWDLDYRDKLSISETDISLRLEELLNEIVSSHLESEVPLGAFLSGGMDSSTVVSFMKDNSKIPVKTFSIGFDIKSHNELNYADTVSQYLGVENKKFITTAKAIDILFKLIWHLDEPFADTSIIPTYLLCKLTKDYVTVALSGDGGDEIFGGYSWMSRYYISSYFNQLIPEFLRGVLNKLFIRDKSTIQYRTGYFNKLKRLNLDANLSLEDGFLRRTTFDRGIMNRILIHNNKDFDPCDIQRSYFAKAKVKDTIEKMLYVDTMMYLPEVCLFKVDRMSMANSLEVRVPLLDHKLVEFVAKIPFGLKLKGSTSKYILKKTMAKRLPYETLHKPKRGFSIPVDSWLRQDLQAFATNLLLENKTKNRGFFNSAAVKEVLEKHKSGSFNLGYVIWALLVFEIWARTYLDKNNFQTPS
jgi:asparagine synthase (glutamine-hydrolysing)